MLARVRLWLKLFFAHVLLWFAGAGRTGDMRPEVHLYLADLHFRLAAEYERAHQWRVARRHRHIANQHAQQGPAPNLPPAAAMAMPVPKGSTFVDARSPGSRWPTDIA